MNQPIEWSPPRSHSPFKAQGSHRIPNRVYSDSELHAREMEALFYKAHWCYVALECEIPNIGDFKSTMIGEKPVIVVRDRDGSVNVLENRCAHKGAKQC
jgi:salicylate 5-hydroxylase large subunit